MKILQWHCEYFRYKVTKPAMKILPENRDGEQKEFKNVIVALVSVEKGDEPETARNAIIAVKKQIDEVKADCLLIYPYAHLSNNLATPSIAITILKEMESFAKQKGIDVFRAPFGYYKEFETKVKGHPLAELSKTLS
ncbi:MAG: threonyl-tRNA synthetase editing domain-containing protein [Nanoarchaeota archaeon]|nr:threonyl-tRNA synthetase editing domain-containing protein [Nanoarchaeota archaeon]